MVERLIYLVVLAALCACANAAPARADALRPDDETFVALRDAARANEAQRVLDLAARLPANYAIPSYVEYYKLRVRIFESGGAPRMQTPDDEIRAFLLRWQGEAIADRLRNDWLLALGKQRNAAVFAEQYPQFVLKDDTQVECYAQAFRLQRLLWNEAAQRYDAPSSSAQADWLRAEAQPLLRDPRQYTDGCMWLIESAAGAGLFDNGRLWGLLRNAYDQNVVAAGRRIARLIPDADPDAIDQVAERGKAWLAKADLKSPAKQQVAVLALLRIGRNDPIQAGEQLQRVADRLAPADRAYVWSKLGEMAARRTLPEARDLFARADAVAADAQTDDDVLRWQARAALRAGDWAMVRQTIERMSTDALRDSTWTYWLARALRREGQPERADALLQQIAGEYGFYGRLAAEDLGLPMAPPVRGIPATEQEIAPIAANAGFARALRFYAMDLRFEGTREWNWQLRGMTDRQLLAAAEYARRMEVFDRAISTAERTKVDHDFGLRFLTPYRDVFAKRSSQAGLDNAWVVGLVRQESRFVVNARSGVGASGLMQVMPTTAKYVARKIGLADFRPGAPEDVDTNILIGTSYLRMVLDDLDGSAVLASAAYNAGPSRSRQWRSTLSHSVEGAIFVETIPFHETRDYVKKVLSNAVYYAALFEGRPQSLKARLGTIQPKDAGQSDLP